VWLLFHAATEDRIHFYHFSCFNEIFNQSFKLMRFQDLSELTVGKPAAWLMALPLWGANLVCAAAYLLAATGIQLVFALPNALWVAGSAASGLAVAGALMCGRKVLPGLWLARVVWEIMVGDAAPTPSDCGLAVLAATALVLQTEIARIAVLALQILPSKLRRLRKSIQIAGTGLLASSAGTTLYVAGLALLPTRHAVPDWGLQAAGLLLPEWAGIALLLPLTIVWLQDDAWREPRKWRVTLLVGLACALTWGLTARAVWSNEQQTLTRLHDSNTALGHRLDADFRSARHAVDILQSHLETSPRESAANFNRVAAAIRASAPQLQALSWTPLITHAQRSSFEDRLRKEFGLHANPERRAAMERAMASGQPTLSPRIPLAQETGNSWGALYLRPLTDQPAHPAEAAALAPQGFVVAVLRMEDIVGSAVEALRFANFRLASGESPRRRVVHYRFGGLNEPADTQTLFSDGPSPTPHVHMGLDSYRLLALPVPAPARQVLVFADRQYFLQSTPTRDFWEGEIQRTPFLALGIGMALTWMTLSASLMLTGSTQLLTLAVERRTEELQRTDAELQRTNARLQQQSVQLRSVLEAMDQGYMGFDADGMLVLSNDKGFDLIGLPPGEDRHSYLLVARHMGRQFHLAQAQALSVTQSMLSVRNNKQNQVYRDLAPLHPQADARYLDMRVHTFEDPGLRTIVLLHDTTPAMQLERSKSQFMSFAAHEIRTPLTVILGYADLLATRKHSSENVQEMGQQILRKSQGLNQLLQRMLDLSEMDMNGLDIQRTRVTDLGALCALVAHNLSLPEGRMPPVLQHLDPIPWCRVDPAAVTMAVTELLHNAYAFSPAGTPVVLCVGPIHQDADDLGGVRIRISDQGEGMTQEVQQHIFERFYRADSSGKHPGFGLGLSTAKLIADLHKATLRIHSTPGEGTVVELDIPQGDV
jgi:signal transduction histidine kinase/sensor domain CHASE-containing protein